jgi:hypothetical protein
MNKTLQFTYFSSSFVKAPEIYLEFRILGGRESGLEVGTLALGNLDV